MPSHIRDERLKRLIPPEPEPQTLQPGEALTFVAAQTLGTTDSTITVQWDEDDANGTRTWKYPLPVR